MSIPCPDCAAEMPDTAAYCPGCGRSMLPVERAHGMVGMLPETLAGALAYFLLPAIGFFLVGLVSMVVGLAFFMIWVVLVVKALQGEMFKLPLVGEYAEQQTPAG